jgi:hypothetical protein
MKTVCCQCGKKVIGRTDKKFCDAICKNSFHNDHRKRKPAIITRESELTAYNKHVLVTGKTKSSRCGQMS